MYAIGRWNTLSTSILPRLSPCMRSMWNPIKNTRTSSFPTTGTMKMISASWATWCRLFFMNKIKKRDQSTFALIPFLFLYVFYTSYCFSSGSTIRFLPYTKTLSPSARIKSVFGTRTVFFLLTRIRLKILLNLDVPTFSISPLQPTPQECQRSQQRHKM